MRKLLLLSTLSLVIYVPISASNAQTLLKKARDDYYKQQAAEAKMQKAKAAEEAKAQREAARTQRTNTERTKVEKSETEEITNNDFQDDLNLTDQNENKTEKQKKAKKETVKKEKEPKPKNQLEILQKTAAKASDRVEFYESVARSVAREEIELKEYNEILGKKKSKYNKVPNIDGLGN